MDDSNSRDFRGVDPNGTIENSVPTSSSPYKLFGRQTSVHQIMGGGKAADVMLWRRRRASIGILMFATFSWLLANHAVFSNKQLETVPELVLSEEMVNSAASLFRAKVNCVLLMAHDITVGKDFRLFFVVVIALWLLSVIGSYISFATLTYMGIIISITVPALYNKFESNVDRYAGIIHQKFTKHYKIVDESLHSRLKINVDDS